MTYDLPTVRQQLDAVIQAAQTKLFETRALIAQTQEYNDHARRVSATHSPEAEGADYVARATYALLCCHTETLRSLETLLSDLMTERIRIARHVD